VSYLSEIEDVLVLKLPAELDASVAPHIQQALMLKIDSYRKVIVDATSVDYISSAGLRLFLILVRHTHERNLQVIFAGVSLALLDTLESVGFRGGLRFAPNVAEAFRELSPQD
jgi:anti-sigma B factor antagonist